MLTDTACKKATCSPDKKRERFADSGGLYLEVSPNGSKLVLEIPQAGQGRPHGLGQLSNGGPERSTRRP